MTDKPQHVTPGLDATINPIVIDDSYREKPKPKSALELLKIHVAWLEENTPSYIMYNSYEIGKMIEEAEKRAGGKK